MDKETNSTISRLFESLQRIAELGDDGRPSGRENDVLCRVWDVFLKPLYGGGVSYKEALAINMKVCGWESDEQASDEEMARLHTYYKAAYQDAGERLGAESVPEYEAYNFIESVRNLYLHMNMIHQDKIQRLAPDEGDLYLLNFYKKSVEEDIERLHIESSIARILAQ